MQELLLLFCIYYCNQNIIFCIYFNDKLTAKPNKLGQQAVSINCAVMQIPTNTNEVTHK